MIDFQTMLKVSNLQLIGMTTKLQGQKPENLPVHSWKVAFLKLVTVGKIFVVMAILIDVWHLTRSITILPVWHFINFDTEQK